MYPAQATQQMTPPVESFPIPPDFFHDFLSQTHLSELSSSTPTSKHLLPAALRTAELPVTPKLDASRRGSSSAHRSNPPTAPTTIRPSNSASAATLTPSILRPKCAAAKRLIMWKPSNVKAPLGEVEERVKWVMTNAWADSTLETYGAGLLAYQAFCDKYQIPEAERAPANTDILSSFVATLAGFYAGSTIRNYFFAVRAWHIIHRLPWTLDQDTIDAVLKGSQALTPPSSIRARRSPVTLEALSNIQRTLDLSQGRDAAVWACAVCCYYGIARLGELTVKTIAKFKAKPTQYVRRQNVSLQVDRGGRKVTAIFIPVTKVSKSGEEIYFAQQDGLTDPESALRNHFNINKPSDAEHLFMHTFKKSRVPLSKDIMLKRLKVCAHFVDPTASSFTGHSFRIGGTLEYLLRGVPFEVVKTLGRWSSNAFQIYLRKHAQILAPYIQNHPDYNTFLQIAMPAVRA
ncbi:hypothetical protein EUX98_g4898 [Antrodiella citrinella]|uniref:Tyr recombinase domain-containing protein n=1 Tax=Antrodiella citrinella TaxID=2447956 RepID=A0A4S4MTS8_9APHY|nr:hypothetical protein EUX98_g4898 [Antrodiella citrinella]